VGRGEGYVVLEEACDHRASTMQGACLAGIEGSRNPDNRLPELRASLLAGIRPCRRRLPKPG
jgi:hypothetical protein